MVKNNKLNDGSEKLNTQPRIIQTRQRTKQNTIENKKQNKEKMYIKNKNTKTKSKIEEQSSQTKPEKKTYQYDDGVCQLTKAYWHERYGYCPYSCCKELRQKGLVLFDNPNIKKSLKSKTK